MAPCNTNCTLWDYGFFDPADYPNYEADPDIAGIGVVTTFVASAFITLCFSVANIILTAFTSSDTNAIDYWVFKITRSLAWFEVTDRTRDLWIPVIEKVVLNLSDQQILTGLAVLIAGFWTHCSISVYHFALLSDLAWFSSNTHLISLGVLRSYFQDKDRVLLRNTRVGLMICMALLLIVSTVLQGHWAWYDSWSFDAQCLFDNLNGNIGGKPRYWMVVYLCLIAFDYTWSMVLLFKVDQWLYDKPKQLFDHALEKYKAKKSESAGQNCLPSIIKRIYHTGIIACAITIRAMHFGLAALLGSRCTDLAVNIFWFSYGLWGLIEDRNIPQSLMDGNENIMSFGQIVPILLISSTVFVFWELYNDQMKILEEHYSSGANNSRLNLVQRRHSAAAAPSVENFELSGAPFIADREGSAEPIIASPRRVDTEMGGRSQASAVEGRCPSREPQRRTTIPPGAHSP